MVEAGQSGDLAVKALSFGEGSGCFSRALVCSFACWLLVGREGEETESRGKVFKGRKEKGVVFVGRCGGPDSHGFGPVGHGTGV